MGNDIDIESKAKQVPKISPGGLVRISHNAYSSLRELSSTKINAVVYIFSALSRSNMLVYKNELDVSSEVIVDIPFADIGSKHDAKALQAEIESLQGHIIKYTYPVPGYSADVSTPLISTVIRMGSHCRVTIPVASLPWYLYLGKGVGFYSVERGIVRALQSALQKRLYISIMSKLDTDKKEGIKKWSLKELAEEIGMNPDKVTYSELRKTIDPVEAMMKQNSRYEILVFKDYAPTVGKGRPAVEYIRIRVRQKDKYVASLETYVLSSLDANLSILRYKNPAVLNGSIILKKLQDLGLLEDYKDKVLKLDPNMDKGHRANIVNNILTKDFHIDITNKNAKREAKNA